MNIKHTIITIIITLVVAATAYLGYTFYKEIALVHTDDTALQTDTATLEQVVSFLNKEIQSAQSTTPATPTTPTK